MCGRFSFALNRAEVLAIAGSVPDPFPEATFNQSPGKSVICLDSGLSWEPVSWGVELVVSEGQKRMVINARSETASDKKIFRKGFRSGRCVLPASGFFEWKRGSSVGQPFFFQPKESAGLLLGGIICGNAHGLSVVILTQSADSWMGEIHHRSPVLIRKDRLQSWLNPDVEGNEAIRDAAFTIQEQVLKRHPVSHRVNRATENDVGLLDPVAEEIAPEQMDLF